MKKSLFCFVAFLGVTSFACAEPANIHWQKQQLINYVQSGNYISEIAQVDNHAQTVLEKAIHNNKSGKKLAIVLDIDETSLSNWQQIKASYAIPKNTGDILPKELLKKLTEQFNDPAIQPTLKLYQFAEKNHVTVFFITGRYNSDREATEDNLRRVGFTKWQQLTMKKPADMKLVTYKYKSAARKRITAQGYDIVLNVGDQYSDLQGGYADYQFKIPDPFYYTA